MLQAISVDSKTLIVKSDDEGDITKVIDFISGMRRRADVVKELFQFAETNNFQGKFKFERDECYDR